MPNLLYRADGGHPVGMGHIQRALRVSRVLSEIDPETRIELVTRDVDAVKNLVYKADIPNLSMHYLHPKKLGVLPQIDLDAFIETAKIIKPDAIIVDMLDSPDQEMKTLRSFTSVLITLDDRGLGRLYSDLIINFLVRDNNPSQIDSRRTWLREGPQYATLDDSFYDMHRNKIEPEHAKRILVTMGGADALGLTVKVAKDLLQLNRLEQVDFAIGPAFTMREELDKTLKNARWKANVFVSLSTLLPLYEVADIAIVAGGITMHEAACCGVPAIAVCQPIDHQLLVAGWLEDAGCMINLGYGERIKDGEIASAVRMLSSDQQRRQLMSDAGPIVCDGRGSQRVAKLILNRCGDLCRTYKNKC